MSWRKSLIVALVGCVALLPASDSALFAEAAGASPGHLKEKVDLLGEGAPVRIKLASGQKFKGVIQSANETRVIVDPTDKKPSQSLTYDEIAELQPAENSYKAIGAIDPIEARRAVVGLGIGEHVLVQVGEQKLRGHIRAIGMENFTLQPDGQPQTADVAYRDVRKVHKNLSAGATFAIVVGIVAAAALIAVWLTDSDSVRESF